MKFQAAPSSRMLRVFSVTSELGPAHYTCNRERTLLIADQYIKGRERPFHAIEGGQFFAIFCRDGW